MNVQDVPEELKLSLNRLLINLNISKYGITSTQYLGKGVNYTGDMKQVDVEGKNKNGDNVKLHLIVKLAPSSEILRTMLSIRLLYERETYIYEEVFPHFRQLQIEQNVAERFESYPKFYLSSDKDHNEFVIMDNMEDLGFQIYDQRNTLDFNHTMLVIKELGKFHAISFMLRERNPEVFQEISNNTCKLPYNPEFRKTYEMFWNYWYNVAIYQLGPIKDEIVYKKLKNLEERVFDIAKNHLWFKPNERYLVLGHCDCWVPNMMFKYENASVSDCPVQLCLLDWQVAKVCSPAFDLSQFLLGCTDRQLRALHYEDLINAYYQSFSSFVRQFGSDPDELFPYDVLQEHLKKYSVFGLCTTMKMMFALSVAPEDVPDVHRAKDRAALEKLIMTVKKDDSIYNRIKDVILDFIEYGYDM